MSSGQGLVADLRTVSIVDLPGQLNGRTFQNERLAQFCFQASETLEAPYGQSPLEQLLRFKEEPQTNLIHPSLVHAYAKGTSLEKSNLPNQYLLALACGQRISRWLTLDYLNYAEDRADGTAHANHQKHRDACIQGVGALNGIIQAANVFAPQLYGQRVPTESANGVGLAIVYSFLEVAELYDHKLWLDLESFLHVADYVRAHLTEDEHVHIGMPPL